MTMASALERHLAACAKEFKDLSAARGHRVDIDFPALFDRSYALKLQHPGFQSANGSCRMIRASDAWIAVNLPRASDIWTVPAWIGCELDADPWLAIAEAARARAAADLVEQAQILGIPVAQVGEIVAETAEAALSRRGEGRTVRKTLGKVIDFTSMWAGPLCGALLASAGAEVIKVESRDRPDAARDASLPFYTALNGLKKHITIDLAAEADVAWLGEQIATTDIFLTSARPRAFAHLGLDSNRVFAANPSLTWVAISGYGWLSDLSNRVAFGDDAAAAGGLVNWNAVHEPHFFGDASADPLTGIAAALGALRAVQLGGGFLVDAAMARVAAGVAALAAG